MKSPETQKVGKEVLEEVRKYLSVLPESPEVGTVRVEGDEYSNFKSVRIQVSESLSVTLMIHDYRRQS